MRQPERSQEQALDQTWNRMLDVSPTPSRAGPVRTVRVKIVGTDTGSESAVTTASFSKTKRYASSLPSSEDCIPQENTAYDERDWRVVSGRHVNYFTVDLDVAQPELAFARTLPAIRVEDLGMEESGVHELDPLRLTLDPRDSAPTDPPSPYAYDVTPTLRLKACAEAPLTRAWQRWENQSPFIAIGTAATFCILSALIVSLLAP